MPLYVPSSMAPRRRLGEGTSSGPRRLQSNHEAQLPLLSGGLPDSPPAIHYCPHYHRHPRSRSAPFCWASAFSTHHPRVSSSRSPTSLLLRCLPVGFRCLRRPIPTFPTIASSLNPHPLRTPSSHICSARWYSLPHSSSSVHQRSYVPQGSQRHSKSAWSWWIFHKPYITHCDIIATTAITVQHVPLPRTRIKGLGV